MIDRSFVHDAEKCPESSSSYADLLLDEMPAGDARRADVEEIRKAGDTALALLEKQAAAAPEAKEEVRY